MEWSSTGGALGRATTGPMCRTHVSLKLHCCELGLHLRSADCSLSADHSVLCSLFAKRQPAMLLCLLVLCHAQVETETVDLRVSLLHCCCPGQSEHLCQSCPSCCSCTCAGLLQVSHLCLHAIQMTDGGSLTTTDRLKWTLGRW